MNTIPLCPFVPLYDLFIPDPGVQIGIHQIDEEIDPHHHSGEKHVDAGDDRVVLVREGGEHQTTQPRLGDENDSFPMD